MHGAPHEIEEPNSLFQSTRSKEVYTIPEILAEFTKNCGRFKSPLSWVDTIELSIAKLFGNSRIFKHMSVISGHTIAPQWQTLLNYLFTAEIIDKPEFEIWPQRNNVPHYHKVGLSSHIDSSQTNSKDVSDVLRGYGTSKHIEEAYGKSVGEILERYFLTLYKKNSFISGSRNSLLQQGRRVMNLQDMCSYLPWQQKKHSHFKYNEDSIMYWTHVRELISGSKTYVPAQLIFWGYNFETTPFQEPTLRQPTTSGSAGHFTFTEAVLSALYEGVERDAFLLFWLNSISPDVLDQKTIVDPSVLEFIASLERYGLTLYILDTTTDIAIPSCVCAIIDTRGNKARISIGGGAGFTAGESILSAGMEALGGIFSDVPGDFAVPKDYEPFSSSKVGKTERLSLWKGKDMLVQFNFFISGKTIPFDESRFGKASRSFGTTQEEYNYVLGLFKAKGTGYEIYCHEVAHPVLKKLGYSVVRIVVPALFPLYLTEVFATLNSTRLREALQKIGYPEGILNPLPHPFP